MKQTVSSNKLSIVIAYRNESKELPGTIEKIRFTAGYSVDIIVVDDASDDGFDFTDLFFKHDVICIRNPERLGCAPSRDIGIEACTTPYIFIIDGHMRFYDNSWHTEILKMLEINPGSIYCCWCKPIDFETGEDMKRSYGCGAFINISQPERNNVLELSWINTKQIPENQAIVEIPCVLGACYAASKAYWKHLKGFEGLRFYSCDEQYISIKAWMDGGGCRLLNNIVIGHLFRDKATYEIKQAEFFHNKLLILLTLFPEELSKKIIRSLKAMNLVEYVRARDSIDLDIIADLKEYYDGTFKKGFNNFLAINDKYMSKR